MRHLSLLVLAVVGCSPAQPAPVTEVSVVAVSASPAATAPPPVGPTRLPSSMVQRRPLTSGECRRYVENFVDGQLAAQGFTEPAIREERRGQVMRSLGPDPDVCHGVLVTESEAKCVVSAFEPGAVERCREPD